MLDWQQIAQQKETQRQKRQEVEASRQARRAAFTTALPTFLDQLRLAISHGVDEYNAAVPLPSDAVSINRGGPLRLAYQKTSAPSATLEIALVQAGDATATLFAIVTGVNLEGRQEPVRLEFVVWMNAEGVFFARDSRLNDDPTAAQIADRIMRPFVWFMS